METLGLYLLTAIAAGLGAYYGTIHGTRKAWFGK